MIEALRPSLSVGVPTYNGAATIGALLAAVGREVPRPEVIVVDSGSTDGTLDIVRAVDFVQLVEIPNAQFGHGRTRNAIADRAEGEVIAFLTQDAVPHAGWASAFADAFVSHPDVVAFVGRQRPPRRCAPPVKHDVEYVFATLGRGDSPTVWGPADAERLGWRATALSNTNCAYRRANLREIGFRDVTFAEDQAFAQDALGRGLWLGYAPAAVVEHGHDLRLVGYWRRQRAEAEAIARELGWAGPSVAAACALAALDTVRWAFATIRDCDRTVLDRLAWLPRLPVYAGARRFAAHAGVQRGRAPAPPQRSDGVVERADP